MSDEKQCPKCAETIKAAAVVCKHCGYDFNANQAPIYEAKKSSVASRLGWGCLILVGGVFALGTLASLSKKAEVVGEKVQQAGTEVGSGQVSPSDAVTEAIQVTAMQLAKAYEDNEAAAQKQFGSNPLLVTGKVTAIDLDLADNPVVVLAGTNPFLGPRAQLADASKEAATSLHKGQSVTLLCQKVSEAVSMPILDDCDLQQP